jgi:hypothetical protein
MPTGKATAAKEADVEAAGTVIDGGTARKGLPLDNWIIEPPAGAALESVTLHVFPAVAAVHCRLDTQIELKTAPVPEIARDEPVDDDATGFCTATETLGIPFALKEAVPTMPLGIAFEFMPVARQV